MDQPEEMEMTDAMEMLTNPKIKSHLGEILRNKMANHRKTSRARMRSDKDVGVIVFDGFVMATSGF